MNTEIVDIFNIYLDPKNPRFEPIEDQISIIEHLVSTEKIKELAKDIAEHGLSPLDTIAAFLNAKGRYVALEGNRRLCALMLLNDPDRAPEKSIGYFRDLQKNARTLYKTISCHVFKSRDDANIWLERRHQGEDGGKGISSWSSQQISRHKRSIGKKDENALALSFLEYAESKGFITKLNQKKILTTASRYLRNPYFRGVLGIASSPSDAEIEIKVPYEEFDVAVKNFCQDLLENTLVNSRSKKSDWIDYADQLVKNGIAPTSIGSKRKLQDWNAGLPLNKGSSSNSSNNNGGSGLRQSNNQSPLKRKYIIPSAFKVSISDRNLKKTFDEMRFIDVDDYPLAVACLARIFLENVYENYLIKTAGHKSDKGIKSHKLLEGAINEIEKDSNNLSKPEKSSLAYIRSLPSNSSLALNHAKLGIFAHGSAYPNGGDLKNEWDNIEAIVKYMLTHS